ncbi:MAG: hypothetical protein JOZ86_16485 [Candidatus Eremiobacteraeota bacterium]|nr:hypothetical protein [Candidatus Eremiobacteraeota bacterium]
MTRPSVRDVGVFVADVLRTYLLYVVMVIAGTSLLMLAADAIGFLSYSDRPGAGWHGLHIQVSMADAEFIFSFALFAVAMSVLSCAVPAVVLLVVILRRLSIRGTIIASVVVPSAAISTLWLFAAAGWYVAIGQAFMFAAVTLSVPFSLAVSSPNGLRVWKFRVRAF